uniref:DNA-directed RNA polymerase III subunit RPC3 n=1 Tax=Pristionchus pacificus TaxID=54126 RepID=A0A8R1UI93_PRIPA
MPCGRREVDLCTMILEDHFGPTVARVGQMCLREKLTLGGVIVAMQRVKGGEEKIPPKKVRRALSVLEQHNLLTIGLDSAYRATYETNPDAVQMMMTFPRACLTAKKLYGSAAEAICEELASKGRLSCSEAIRRVRERLELPAAELKQKFCWLAESQFLVRCPPIESKCRGTPVYAAVWEKFAMPDEIAEMPDTTEEEAAKQAACSMEEDIKPDINLLKASRKRKAPIAEVKKEETKKKADPDASVLWQINISRFRRYVRDEIVLEQVCGRMRSNDETGNSEKSAQNVEMALRALLKVAELKSPNPDSNQTPPITLMDVVRAAKEAEMTITKQDLDWAFALIVDDSRGIVRKAGDSGGGLFVLDFDKALLLAVDSHVDSLIREQIDSKAVRIRRLIRARGYLEEETIDKTVMMSAKQTRDLLYSMLEENYVCVKPIGRTNDFAPARTIGLYYVDQPQTVRTLIESTCMMLRNIIVRRLQLEKDSKHLLERQLKMVNIMNGIDASQNIDEEEKRQQKAEVEDMYMPADVRRDLEIFQKNLSLLHTSEIEIEKVLFTFRAYLKSVTTLRFQPPQ